MKTLAILLGVVGASIVAGDFVYVDFNDTMVIDFNGVAATTSCDHGNEHKYQPRHGTADVSDNGTQGILLSESTSVMETVTMETDDRGDSATITEQNAGFRHREEYGRSPDPFGCSVRLRLTPSQPFKRGSVWRGERVYVLGGFRSEFSFQISDHSRRCTHVKDKAFSARLYKSCEIHGGDGFAFVVQLDPNATAALGAGGHGMGYEGIRNSIAVEFDAWYNPEDDDPFRDHVTVQVSGPSGGLGPGGAYRVAVPAVHSLGDGGIHTARVSYFPYVKYDLLESFTATPELVPFLKDAGESRRVGTLVVWVDDMDEPLFALPINLAVAMDMGQGEAYVGFTSATGTAFERHDIVDWYFCDDPSCLRTGVPPALEAARLDYHVVSNT